MLKLSNLWGTRKDLFVLGNIQRQDHKKGWGGRYIAEGSAIYMRQAATAYFTYWRYETGSSKTKCWWRVAELLKTMLSIWYSNDKPPMTVIPRSKKRVLTRKGYTVNKTITRNRRRFTRQWDNCASVNVNGYNCHSTSLSSDWCNINDALSMLMSPLSLAASENNWSLVLYHNRRNQYHLHKRETVYMIGSERISEARHLAY